MVENMVNEICPKTHLASQKSFPRCARALVASALLLLFFIRPKLAALHPESVFVNGFWCCSWGNLHSMLPSVFVLPAFEINTPWSEWPSTRCRRPAFGLLLLCRENKSCYVYTGLENMHSSDHFQRQASVNAGLPHAHQTFIALEVDIPEAKLRQH